MCVMPKVRAKMARDNALAQTRRRAMAGTLGPDLRAPGYAVA